MKKRLARWLRSIATRIDGTSQDPRLTRAIDRGWGLTTFAITPEQREKLAPCWESLSRLSIVSPGSVIAQVHEDFAIAFVLDGDRTNALRRVLTEARP